MAKSSVRRDLFAPCIAKTFAISTAAVLHDADAPVNAKHLPCGVIFHGAGNFIWHDVNSVIGVSTPITTVVTAESVGIFCPIAPTALDVTNAVACTVFWNPDV